MKTLMFNPYTGKPRHPSDIASDPEGLLILEPGAPIRSAAKTTSERVQAMRASRDAAGLKRMELYAHPLDWPAIKALAEKLQARRQRKDKREAG